MATRTALILSFGLLLLLTACAAPVQNGTVITLDNNTTNSTVTVVINDTQQEQVSYSNFGAACQTNDDCKCQAFDGANFLNRSIRGICCVGEWLNNTFVCDDFEENECGYCPHR